MSINTIKAQWNINGNTLSSGDWLGSTNTEPIIFKVNNSEYARLINGGSFGIGTTTPGALLNVNGDVLINKLTKIGGSGQATGKLQVLGNVDIGTPSGAGGTAKINFWSDPTTQSSADGYMGINQYAFTLSNTTAFGNSYTKYFDFIGGNFIQSTVQSQFINIAGSVTQSGTAGYTGLKMNITETSVGSGNNYLLNVGTGGASFVSKFNVTNSGQGYFAGNVGIGTTTPSSILHIEGNYNGSTDDLVPQMKVINTSHHGYSFIKTMMGNGYAGGYPEVWVQATNDTTSGIGTISIRGVSNHDMTFQTNNSVKMTLTKDGKLGIGTTSPSQKLEVNGNISLTGNGTDGNATINGQKAKGSIILNVNTDPNNGASLVLYGNSSANYPGSVRFVSYQTNGKIVFSNYNGSTWPDQMTVLANGNVGIGTASPSRNLEIAHNDRQGGITLNQLSDTTYKSEIRFSHNGTELWAIGNDFNEDNNQNFFIWDHAATSARFIINQDGQCGIGGVIPPHNDLSYKLFVNGGIAARDVKVTAGTFPDFVFSENYKLSTIYELDNFIKLNKHLPYLPCADDVIKNQGYELGDMQLKLIRTVEEQSLYIINLQKQIDELKEQINASEKK